MPIKLLICMKYRLFAHALWELLSNEASLDVIGLGCNESEIQRLLSQKPDLALCDLLCFQQVVRFGGISILLIDEEPESPVYGGIQGMVSQGLVGIVSGDADPEVFKRAILKVHSGELWFSRKTLTGVLCSAVQSGSPLDLTPQEIKVLRRIRNGYSNKEIARELCISEQTVKTHCTHLYKKFDVSSRVKLALAASEVSVSFGEF